ncbi:MAG: hypothetical protein PQJ46_07015 [Spirochaetales bacterium]|nr:hypothetical protein [Spirochaetales bacterium]
MILNRKSPVLIQKSLLFFLLIITSFVPVFAEDANNNLQSTLETVIINSTSTFEQYQIEQDKLYKAPEGFYLTMLVDGTETPIVPGTYSNVQMVVTKDTEFMGSYPWNGSTTTPPFRTAYYIDEKGLNEQKSVFSTLNKEGVDASEANGISINGESGDFSSFIVDNAKYSINDASIILNGKNADGSNTNDFAGLGSAITVSGDNGLLFINNSEIKTEGVGKLALFVDEGGSLVVDNSTISSEGGQVYEGYISNADQDIMVTPPWVLGLDGAVGNARTSNIMGNYSTATYVDSEISAKGWAALSTDSRVGGDPQGWMHLTVINSDINVDKSGYGVYDIVNCQQDYYGVRMDVDTIGIILCGGLVNLDSYTEGTSVDIYKLNKTDISTRDTSDRTKAFGIPGDLVTTVKSQKASGVVPSSIKSKNFGFECHSNSNNDWNVINIKKGTSIETGDAVFLIKKVNTEINIDAADIKSDSNVLVQIMDNDDDYVGLDTETIWGPEEPFYGHYNKKHMLTFNSKFHEAEGFSSSFTAEGATFDSGWVCNTSLTNGDYKGDMWNSSGYVGRNGATTMNITIDKGASLTGLISAGEFSHLVKDFEVGDGDWSAADNLGHVKNQVHWNGCNNVNVTIKDGGKWIVTSSCLVSSVNVEDGGELVGTIENNKDGSITVSPISE